MLTQETPHLSQVVTPRVLTLILAAFIGVVLYLSPLEPRLLVSTEAFVYLLLLLACASHAPLRSAVVQMGTTQGLVVGTLLLLAVGGQLYKWTPGSYPFATWSMYANLNPPTDFAQFNALRRSGSTILFPFAEVSGSKRTFQYHFSARLDVVRRSSGASAAKTKAIAELNLWLRSLAQVYNRRHPEDPIRSIEGVSCALPIHNYTGPGSILCEPIISIEVPE